MKTISRRTILRGAGAAGVGLALPWLDAMATPAAGAPPVRLAFFYAPNGIVLQNWRPPQAGALGELPSILAPLEPHKKNVLVLSDLAADFCQGNGAGHEPSTAGLLVGAKCKHSEEPEVAGISVDQLAATKIGLKTPVDSLALGIDPGMRGDHGYSGTYLSNQSWRSRNTPAALELNPKLLFERLFKGRPPRPADWSREEAPPQKVETVEGSVLDLVREDARGLEAKLGFSDRRKMEEFFDGLRGIEKRLDGAKGPAHHEEAYKGADLQNILLPEGKGIPSLFADHVNLLLDILTLAFQTDTTRVASFLFSNEKSGRAYPEINVGSHHSISHHQNKADALEKLTRINTLHLSLFARMVDRMSKIKEGDTTLLENTVLFYGSGISDSNKHNHDNLPILVAGGVRGGRHVAYGRKTTVCNLYLDMLAKAGCPVEKFGDSTAPLNVL
jgi:hypothetical protein